jgi:uncharacterized protein
MAEEKATRRFTLMANYDNRFAQAGGIARPQTDVNIDAGLRAYMGSVYNYMAVGILLTGLVAFGLYTQTVSTSFVPGGARLSNNVFLTPLGRTLYLTPVVYALIFAPLVFSFFFVWRQDRMSPGAAQTMFWIFAVLMGLSMSSIFIRFTGQSIARVFFITATVFGAISLWGYTTKKDLSGWGTFLFMGLIGLLIASIVQLFFPMPMLGFIISCVGVLLFAGLTAYDTQQIKDMYYEVAHDAALASKYAIVGAFQLYTDFIGMFQSLMSLLGDRE